MKYFKLPDLGEGLPEAEILEWHVKEGDSVKTDQVVVSVETAKAIIEVPSPQDGTIAHLFGAPGDTIHTGEPLLEFEGDDASSDAGTVVGAIQRARDQSTRDEFIIGASPSTRAHHSTRATPAVRGLAQRLGVDIGSVSGSGRDGLITADDIEQAAQLNRSLGAPEPLRGVRKQMARNMAEAHAQVVAVTLFDDVDIDHWPDGTDITMRLVQAIAAGCAREPALNAWFDGRHLVRRLQNTVNLGVAVDTEQGLFVPVLRDIGSRDREDLRAGLDRLRADVRARTIPPSELQGATVTLSNFGTLCGRYATPVVMPPQVAIVGAGKIRREPVWFGDHVEGHRMLPLSVTFDHRAATGGEAARFMQGMIETLRADA
ncbi:MAG: 2-oxo acid dehydrogenase subunit E2 [Oceanospirillaceae bacterium]|nr:2-oxo acid dehydrogenase subunit E2 [Oceanospirillaceae bacterium]